MRLKEEALCVKINKLNISEITKFSIEDSQKWFANLENILSSREKKIAQHILKEINERLNFFVKCWFKLFNSIKRVWNFIRW